jgi:hypothetical protein
MQYRIGIKILDPNYDEDIKKTSYNIVEWVEFVQNRQEVINFCWYSD